MALGNATINQLNEKMSLSQDYLRKYYDGLRDGMETLQGNVNYKSFVENTEIGRELNDKLNRIKIVGDKTASDVNQLLKTTSEFTENQRVLNSTNGSASEVSYSSYQGEAQSIPSLGEPQGSTVTIPGGTTIPSSAVSGGVQ